MELANRLRTRTITHPAINHHNLCLSCAESRERIRDRARHAGHLNHGGAHEQSPHGTPHQLIPNDQQDPHRSTSPVGASLRRDGT